jgi:WD repeat-containing protein 45
LQVRREFDNGGVTVAAMLFRSNILALVGGGPVPKYPPTKVMIWDDHQGRAVGEIPLKTPVKAVRLRKDRIAIALESKVCVYDLDELQLLHSTETSPNPDGLLALSPGSEGMVLACPGLNVGQVRVDLLDVRRVNIIEAHKAPLAALALTINGKLLATASGESLLKAGGSAWFRKTSLGTVLCI